MEPIKIDFLLNSNMKYGIGEFKKLPEYLKDMNFLKIVLILDRAIADSEYIKNTISECNKMLRKCELLIYGLRGEPTYDYLDECSDNMRRHPDLDVIVGIGGGSVMDLAKGIAILLTNKGPGINYRGFPKSINRPIPVVAIPTTAGTGSEATYNAVFTDTKAEKKFGINTIMNFPVLSILDPVLVSTCPKEVIASSGMDALTHAMESFVSKKATLISRMYSVEAVKLLIPNLERVLDFPGDVDVKGNLQLGAYLAATALMNSSSGPAGALSYLLGTWYKVPHGAAGAVFLPHIHRFNLEMGYYEYAGLYDTINNGNPARIGKKEKAAYIIDKIFLLNKKFGIKEKLSFYGVKKENLARFEEATSALKAAFDFNPVEIDANQLGRILKGIL